MMVLTRPIDAEFLAAIEGKSVDWQRSAVAGLVTREIYGDKPRTKEWAKQHGLSRGHTQADREAWSFGWEWPDYALTRARSAICDLLQGRVLRQHAEETLKVALEIERLGAPLDVVVTELERAAHWEWIAVRSEWGQIMWGGRLNRCGRPEAVGDGKG